MAVHADQGDAPQLAVGVAVAATVQPVPVSAAEGHRAAHLSAGWDRWDGTSPYPLQIRCTPWRGGAETLIE